MPESGPGPQIRPATDERGRVTRYRVELPHAGIVETQRGHFEATEYAERRTGLRGRYLAARDVVLGATLANRRLETEKLSKVKALPIFSSDAISSVAYATQEILFVLVLAGAAGITWSLPIGLAIAGLLVIVIASYRQVVRAYPGGGGAYIVGHDNLGIVPGLVAAAALLIDYVLTVSVSVASGMDALASLHEGFRPYAVPIAVGIVALIAVINLRGISESATIFMFPTYAFAILLGLAIVVAMAKIFADGGNIFSVGTPAPGELGGGPFEGVAILLILKAFANGCTALTGVEAISNGVQSFKKPAAKNASQTMLAMGAILGFLFLGLTLVARYHAFIPHEDNTVPAQLGAAAFGSGSVLFVVLQIMTTAILVLAANTSFAGFPALTAILARDGYMPRVFHARGNRLVFNSGILVLAGLAAILLVVFNATTTRLIPLYALGVFTGFTIAQAGMVRHWMRHKDPGWKRAMALNLFGACTTALVFVIVMEAKFVEGAWMVIILIPLLATVAWLIGRFYKKLRRTLHVTPEAVLDLKPEGASRVPVIVPVEDVNLATVMTLGAACERSRDVTAVHVVMDPDEPSTVEQRWNRQFPNIPLVVIDSPFRSVSDPIAVYIDDRLRSTPAHELTVMVPLLQVRHWYQRPLVNQSLKGLRKLVARRRQVEVVHYAFDVGEVPRGRR